MSYLVFFYEAIKKKSVTSRSSEKKVFGGARLEVRQRCEK